MSELVFTPALSNPGLLAPPVAAAIEALAAADPGAAAQIEVAEIDATLADTAEFCAHYGQPLEASANCIVITGKRGETVTHAACMVLATTRADINGTARRLLDARRASFTPMDEATALTGMEYGGITPLGLPSEWRLLVDSRIGELPRIIIGAGIRGAKLFLPGSVLAGLPRAEIVEGLAN